MTAGPIDAFLAELGRLLRRDDDARTRIVCEVGDHLRDLATEARARGLGDLDAELDAVERFGSPRALARGLRPGRRRSRGLGVALSLMLAGAGAGLAYGVLHSPGGPHAEHTRGGVAIAQVPAPIGTTITDEAGCLVAIPTASGARQALVIVTSRVAIDPRTGRIVSCHPLYRAGATMRPLASGIRSLTYGWDARYLKG